MDSLVGTIFPSLFEFGTIIGVDVSVAVFLVLELVLGVLSGLSSLCPEFIGFECGVFYIGCGCGRLSVLLLHWTYIRFRDGIGSALA